MSTIRIKDLNTTSKKEGYVLIDGATNGTRKIDVSYIGNLSFDQDYTSVIVNAGNYYTSYITVQAASGYEDKQIQPYLSQIQAYLVSTYNVVYPLEIVYISNSKISFQLKSLYNSPNSDMASTSGYIHFVAPFPMTVSPM